MKNYLPEIILLVMGLAITVLLLFLGAVSDGWVELLCYLGAAVVFTGWYRILLALAWRLARRDPDDFDFHLPG
jgi:hypothetical protein